MKGKLKIFLVQCLVCFSIFQINILKIHAQEEVTGDKEHQKAFITMDLSQQTLQLNDSYKRTAQVYSDDEKETVEYTSSNEEVATVTQDGVVKAKGYGTAIITATLIQEPSIKESYEIRVIRKFARNEMMFIAHRGYSKVAPENSLPAFEEAGKAGFNAVECDIHETAKDKKGKRRFVIMHDKTLNRMCNLQGKLVYQKKLTYKKLRKNYYIKTGNNCERYTKKQLRIPTLEEYFSICKKYNMTPIVEIKQKMNKAAIDRLYKCIKKEKLQKKIIITSKYQKPLMYMRKHNSRMQLQLVINNADMVNIDWLVKYHVDVCIYKKVLTDEMIALLEGKNIKVNVWTINDQEQLSNYGLKGISTVTSDDILWE